MTDRQIDMHRQPYMQTDRRTIV